MCACCLGFLKSLENKTGAIYTSCYSLGFCTQAMKMMIGIPTAIRSRREMISLVDNNAEGYGKDVATAPAKVRIVSGGQQHIPGKTPLDFTFSLFDALGAPVRGSALLPVEHLVQLLVLPVQAVCSTFAICERLKIQPAESFLSSGEKETTSILLDYHHTIFLKYCQIGVSHVRFRLFLSTGDLECFHIPCVEFSGAYAQESNSADAL